MNFFHKIRIIEEENTQKDIGLYNKKTGEKIPLYYIDIDVDIKDQFSKVKLTHKYFNPTQTVIDAEFLFQKGL